VDIEAFKKIDANSLNAKLSNAGTADKIGALTALAPFILDRTYVENERMNSSPKMRQALTVFMRALVGDSQTKGPGANRRKSSGTLDRENSCRN
jgi:hypothetical protein